MLALLDFEILRSKRIGVTSLTLRGHVTSSAPFDTLYAISNWWFFGTESLFPVVLEIFGSKRIGVTSYDLSWSHDVIGHVTI